MKFEFNWPSSFCENGLYIDGYPIWATLVERSWLNLDLWNLFINSVSLGLTYQVRIMTLASTVFKKSTFQNVSHLNALGSKFNLGVKSRIIIWIGLGKPYIPNVAYQVPRSSAFWFWRRFFKGSKFTKDGRGSHFGHSYDQDHLNKLWFITLRSLNMKFEFNWLIGFRVDVWKCWRTTDGRMVVYY